MERKRGPLVGMCVEGSFAPTPRPRTADLAWQRRALEESFKRAIGQLDTALVVDVGCGDQPWRSEVERRGGRYVGVDLAGYSTARAPDIVWGGEVLPLRSGTAPTVLVTEVLEHVPDPLALLSEIHRVLVPGGSCYFSVPFLWPLHDSPHDEQRLTPFALRRLADIAEFDVIALWHLGGWDSSLARMLALWVRRRPMNRWSRLLLSHLLFPFIAALERRDVAPAGDFDGMITGSAGVLRRRIVEAMDRADCPSRRPAIQPR